MKFSKVILLASSVFVLAACGGDKEPEECTKLYATIEACGAKNPNSNPEMIKEQLTAAKDSLKTVTDKKVLAQQCKALEEVTKQGAKMANIDC